MTQVNQLIRRFNRQLAEVQPDGYILQGSVVKRYLERQVGGALKTFGPYYLWTRKISNKTVTKALSVEQARLIRQAILRNQQLERRLRQLRSSSEQIIRAITPCVAIRKRI
jgi:hypothetical protein